MIQNINSFISLHSYKPKLHSVKNNTVASNSAEQNIKFAKIPVVNYQISFLGRNYQQPNSKRKYTNYGNNLYIGSQSSPVDRYKAKAKYVQLDNADLRNYNFEKANFYRACLQGSKLQNASFEKANLYNVNMRNTKTENTNFAHANLNFADFTGADFGKKTDMSGANVIGATFSDTDLDYVYLENALYDETTIFPADFDPDENDMIFLSNGSNLSNLGKKLEYAKMRFMTLRDVNFKNNSLKRADLKKMDITRGNFDGATLTRTYAPEIEAKNCSFRNAKMKQTNFDGAIFDNIDMSNADLRGAIFTFDSAYNIKLNGARYDQFTVFNDGFNPKAHGMIYEESSPGVYGAKSTAEVRSFKEWM